MKKTIIALSVAALAAAVNAAPQANSVYVGAKAGWASFHHNVNQFDHAKGGDYGINRNSVTYGVFAGYQIINNLAVEAGYDYFGRIRGNMDEKRAVKHSAHGTNLALKANYEALSGLDTYGKVGTALVRNDYKQYSGEKKVHNFKASLLLGAGVEYAITPSLGARVEYQWLSRAGNLDKAIYKATQKESNVGRYSPDIHSVSAGLTYRFGQGIAPAAPVAAGPEVVSKRFAFSSDVLFDFGKANLKPEAAAALDAANTEIQSLSLVSPMIQVNGYTDRIGKDASNLKLSQRRAETVANYMVSKGISPENVTAVGHGKANPVTGNSCDAVKGRQAVIACLAPDRRVELQVQGTREVVM